MDEKFYLHLKAFLISHQIGDDPNRNLAKIKVIANTNPERWNGKLPTRGILPDTDFCKVAESTGSRPVLPWWWYPREKEPVPSVVQDIYDRVAFDFAVIYPRDKAWIYVCVEPAPQLLALLRRQEQLKAFILISLINKKFPKAQREHRRVRLGNVMQSAELNRVFVFVACREEDARYKSITGRIPTITRLVHTSSNTANWSIRLPGDAQVYASFREIIEAK